MDEQKCPLAPQKSFSTLPSTCTSPLRPSGSSHTTEEVKGSWLCLFLSIFPMSLTECLSQLQLTLSTGLQWMELRAGRTGEVAETRIAERDWDLTMWPSLAVPSRLSWLSAWLLPTGAWKVPETRSIPRTPLSVRCVHTPAPKWIPLVPLR